MKYQDMTTYQEDCLVNAIYPERGQSTIGGIAYTTLGLAGEAGEIANKIKKVLRQDKAFTRELARDIADEIGDVLWYAAALANELGYTLAEVAEMNREKLDKRRAENKLKGDGDKR